MAQIRTRPILYVYKFDDDRIKMKLNLLGGDIVCPIISQCQLSVVMATTALMDTVPNPKITLSPTQLMLHIKFDQNWPTDLGDSIISLLKS